ncbi:MAG: DUF2634 domain-containing protein [Roseburia sp.]|nr:DUF2634 domain-containing protein [Roseburia sp.]
MNIVGENCIDIELDADGQPVCDVNGDFSTVSGDECWKQDLRMECYTEEAELFYEDEDGEDAYGFGMLDFAHAENDEFTMTEIRQRISGKLGKRTYLDSAKTVQEITYNNGDYHVDLTIAKQDSNDDYNIELSTEDVEVEKE